MSNIKKRVFTVIQPAKDSNSNMSSLIFDWFIIVLIVANVLLVILDTFKGFSDSAILAFRYVETTSVAIFTIEYALRVWTSDLMSPSQRPALARIRYVLSFMAIIDLLAIMPFYLPFIFPVDLRVLRIVRLFRILRILKVNRYTNALSAVSAVIKRKAPQIISSMLVVFVLMIIASVLMYSIESEAQPDVFQNAFSGIWWAVATLTTVGYGDIYPITVLGKVLSAIIALLGIGLVAVPTGIISAGFVESVEGQKNEYCPHCNKRLS